MSFLPESMSTVAPEVDSLFILITALVIFWFTVVVAALFYGVMTSLKKEGGKAKYITGESWSQSKWLWIPLVLVILSDLTIDMKTVGTWSKVMIEADQPAADYDVKIVGHQFYWEIIYPGPDGKILTADDVTDPDGGELVLPVGKVSKLHLTSGDVLHSFFVREFRFKNDVIPGRIITRWVQPTSEGTVDLMCAEICGPGHGLMGNKVKIVSEDEFKAYMTKLNSAAVAMAK